MEMILEIIIIVMACFMVDLFTYKYIRYLDKKERRKLAEKETEYLKNLIEEMNKPIISEDDLFDN